ncbi:hypothetical protein [Mycobacterium sp.]|uniref:hypothetical protein n=1 Tax=Mycobacterium sp. TaxID=1785 RepID=UPI0031E3908E
MQCVAERRFGVSRITVRRALADLADHGYIERRHNLRQAQFQRSVDVVESDTRPPPTVIGGALNIDAEMLHIWRGRSERRTCEPLMITEAWLPADLADVLTASAPRRRPVYELLSAAGIVVPP